MSSETELVPYSPDFLKRLKELKDNIYRQTRRISKEKTPEVDGTGKKIINKRPDGHDYIEESYMRDALNRHFPGWTWEMAAPLHFLGAEWVVAQGHLCIVDEHLIAFGINPPVRKFFGVDSVRIQYKRDAPHTPENIVDVGDNCKQANTAAFKYAINRLTNIGDDVYGKRLEMEGAGTAQQVIETQLVSSPGVTSFYNWYTSKRITNQDVFKILNIKSLTEITDFKKAQEEVIKAKGIK